MLSFSLVFMCKYNFLVYSSAHLITVSALLRCEVAKANTHYYVAIVLNTLTK